MDFLSYADCKNDAGLLREYIAQRYGSVLANGGLYSTYIRARTLVERLAQLTGLTQDEVMRDVIANYEVAIEAV